MAFDPAKLDALMILVCVVALVILLALAFHTWIKWHQEQLHPSASNEPPPHSIELTGVNSTTPFQRGYLNEAGKDSPNLSGSRTFLNEDVLKQKPYPKDGTAPSEFQTKDVIYHANAERNPNELAAGDIVYHANGHFNRDNNTTANRVEAGHVAFHAEDPSGKRRWSESMARTDDSDGSEVSHRKNTYL